MGAYNAALSYKASHKMRYKLGGGQTRAYGRDIYQVNGSILWEPMTVGDGGWAWTPLSLGASVIYSPNPEFFIVNGPPYPDEDYYEPTALLGMGQIGTSLNFGAWGFNYYIAVPQPYLIAKWNNPKWDSKLCCSSGFEILLSF
jgi:hypothetical protein